MKLLKNSSFLAVLIPILLSGSTFITFGLVGILILLPIYPASRILLIILGYITGVSYETSSIPAISGPEAWPAILVANFILPLIYIPIYFLLKFKMSGKKLFFLSIFVCYVVEVLLVTFLIIHWAGLAYDREPYQPGKLEIIKDGNTTWSIYRPD